MSSFSAGKVRKQFPRLWKAVPLLLLLGCATIEPSRTPSQLTSGQTIILGPDDFFFELRDVLPMSCFFATCDLRFVACDLQLETFGREFLYEIEDHGTYSRNDANG